MHVVMVVDTCALFHATCTQEFPHATNIASALQSLADRGVFGFASALNEVGLPQTAIPVALLFLNVGVEIGQLLFIASVFAAIARARRITRRIGMSQPAWAWRVPPYAIGRVGPP